MSTIQENQDSDTELPQETEALIRALHRKTNYQAERIDKLERTVADLQKRINEVEK